MDEKIKTVKAEVFCGYVRVYAANLKCPHCTKISKECLDEEMQNKVFLHCCKYCGGEFFIDIPSFPLVKQKKSNEHINAG